MEQDFLFKGLVLLGGYVGKVRSYVRSTNLRVVNKMENNRDERRAKKKP